VITASKPATTTGDAGAARLSDLASALVTFNHLRWDGVVQRPQHLLTRFARDLPVIVIEEPIFAEGITDDGEVRSNVDGNVRVITPVLPASPDQRFGFTPENVTAIARLIEPHVAGLRWSDGPSESIRGPIVWYYTPMALG